MTMKHTYEAIIFLVLAASLASCKEDTLDVYHGEDYVHFTPGADDVAVTSYNFALDGVTTAETSVLVPVELTLWGYLPTEDFRCEVSVVAEGTTAISSDYEDPGYATFRAGHHVDTLWVRVNRKEELLATDYSLRLRLDSAGDAHVVGPSSYSTVTLHIFDRITDEPSWWGTTQALGPYSAMKYRLLNIYLGKILRNLDEYTSITFKDEALAFKAWWKRQWEEGNHRYYDTDGTTPLYDTIPD